MYHREEWWNMQIFDLRKALMLQQNVLKSLRGSFFQSNDQARITLTSVNYNTVIMNVPHYEDRSSKWKLLLPKTHLSYKRLFISFPQKILKRKKSHPFLYTFHLFHGFAGLLYECMHICMSIQKSKSEQTFATSVFSPLCSWSLQK